MTDHVQQNKMKCLILGCGTSTGVPLPGCRCPVCTSKNPKNFRNRTSALVELKPGFNLLIDASPDLRHQALKFNVPSVDAVLFTHAHADHILGVDDLRSFNFVHRNRIPCFGTKETLDAIKKTFHYIFDQDPNYEGGLLAQLDLNPIEFDRSFTILDTEILPVMLHHGKTIVTGFKIGNMGYATDCKKLSEQAFKAFHDIDVLVLDALRYEQHRTHFTIDEAVATAKELSAKQTYLVHMTHSVDYDEVSKALPPGVELAYDGLSFYF